MRTTLGTTQRATLAIGSAATLTLLAMTTPAQAASSHASPHASSTSAHAEKARPGEHPGKGRDRRASSNKDGRGHDGTWQAQADPDGQQNGGIDQPGGTGGADRTDQDGNNGSGNDADCEDDNRGKGVPGHCKATSTHGSQGQDRTAPRAPGRTDDGRDGAQDAAKDAGKGTEAAGGSATSTEDATATRPGLTPSTSGPVVLGIERTVRSSASTPARTPVQTSPSAGTVPSARAAAELPNTGAQAATLALLASGLGTVAAGTVLVRRRRTDA